MQPQPPPPTPPAPVVAGPLRPGRSRYLIAALVLLLIGIPSVLAFMNGFDAINNGLIRVPVPGDREIDLEPGTWTVFYEHNGEFEGEVYATPRATPDISIIVTGRGGQQIPVVSSNASFNYNLGGHAGYSIAKFETEHGGRHRVVTMTTNPNQKETYLIALGQDLGKATLLLVLGVIGMLAAAVLAFIAWLLVFVMRYRAKKRLEAAGYGSPG